MFFAGHHPNVRHKSPRVEYQHDPRSIAKIYQVEGDMAAMRAINREKIRQRGEQSRKDAKNYLQGKIRGKVA